MLTINIAETSYTDNPNDIGKKIVDVDKFIDGFKQLCKKTNLSEIDYIKLGFVTCLKFKDGTSIGIKRLFREIGVDFDK